MVQHYRRKVPFCPRVTNQVDLLRDLFVWAYERSCQRYLAITQTMAEPDPLRILYREVLIKAVQIIVQDGMVPTVQNIQNLTDELVLGNDRQSLSKLVLDAIQRLHDRNMASSSFCKRLHRQGILWFWTKTKNSSVARLSDDTSLP